MAATDRHASSLLNVGGPYRTRTCDPLRVMQVRYQLRQRPRWAARLSRGVAAAVADEDRENQAKSDAGGEDEADDGEAGIAQQLPLGVDPHQQCGTDDECGQKQAGDDAVGEPVERAKDLALVDALDREGDLALGDGVEQAVEAGGQLL